MLETFAKDIDPAVEARMRFHRSIAKGQDTDPMINSAQDLRDFFKISLPDNKEGPSLPILSWGIEHIQRYYDHADAESKAMVKRKIKHTYDVMCKILEIAQETGEEWNIPQLINIAFLHDICRFPQAFHYKTFKDGDSFDHADLGAETVVRAQLPFAFLQCDESEVLNAISEHSGLKTPENRYARIIRDADKMVIVEEFMDDTGKLIDQDIEREDFDERALQELLQGKVVASTKKTSRQVNRILQRISWINDLNFEATSRIALRDGVFDRLYDQLTQLTNDPRVLLVREYIDRWKEQAGASHFFNGLYAEEIQAPIEDSCSSRSNS